MIGRRFSASTAWAAPVLAALASGGIVGCEGGGGASSAAGSYFEWRPGASGPVPRIEAAGTMADGRLIVASGFADRRLRVTPRVDAYDPATDAWVRLPDIPRALTHADLALEGGRLWIAGGFVGDNPGAVTDAVWRFDLETEEWTAGPPLPEPRGGGALVAREGHLHYFGGFASDRNTNAADHWILRTSGSSGWVSAAPLPEPRGQLGAVMLDGEIYAVGGQFFHDSSPGPVDVDLVHAYDPRSDSWRRVAGLPTPRSHAEAATFVHRGRIVVAGGRSNTTGRETVADVSMYDPATDLWLALPDLPTALLGSVAASLVEDGLLVFGGSEGDWRTPRSATWIGRLSVTWERGRSMPVPLGEVSAGIVGERLYVVGAGSPATLAYHLGRDTWTPPGLLTPRPFPGAGHAAEVWDGRLFLLGGSGQAAGRTQVYDPATDTWTIGADMPFEAAASASGTIDGRIYVAGGAVGGTATGQAARYDPDEDEWTLLSPMRHARSHAASATDGERLFVFGGRGPGDEGEAVGGSAEVQVYDPGGDRWISSRDPGSSLPSLPRARSGMGRAIHVEGRFYLLGGEAPDAGGANRRRVSGRVDVYDPATGRWRTGTPMPTARRGIFPVTVAGRIYVAGGDRTGDGSSATAILEVYNAGDGGSD